MILKDLKNVDKDYTKNKKTLPIVIGRKRAKRIALGFSVLLLLFLIIVIKRCLNEKWFSLWYSIVFLLIPIGYLIYKLYDAKTKKDFSFLNNFIKLIIGFGILSVLLFKFI